MGRNGYGKSTLMNALAKRELAVPPAVSMLHVAQEVEGKNSLMLCHATCHATRHATRHAKCHATCHLKRDSLFSRGFLSKTCDVTSCYCGILNSLHFIFVVILR